MVVVVIIGLLLAISLPAFSKVRINAYASRIANNFRVFSAAFETHALESGNWAPGVIGNALPEEVASYLKGTTWDQEPIPGGYYDWEYDREGFTASISLAYDRDFPEVFTKVDQIVDDGNLSSGRFVKISERYFFVLEK